MSNHQVSRRSLFVRLIQQKNRTERLLGAVVF
jgi:hypothetical protein